jgi:hypothetical protein
MRGNIMIDKESEINKELEQPSKEADKRQSALYKQINSVLAYGSTNLGLNNFSWENDSEERQREDLKR